MKRFLKLNCHKSEQTPYVIFLWFMETRRNCCAAERAKWGGNIKAEEVLWRRNNKILFQPFSTFFPFKKQQHQKFSWFHCSFWEINREAPDTKRVGEVVLLFFIGAVCRFRYKECFSVMQIEFARASKTAKVLFE